MNVLAMFICLQGQFVDSVKDLLHGRGLCPIAGFCHGGVQMFGLDKSREEVVAKQLLMLNPSYLIMVG